MRLLVAGDFCPKYKAKDYNTYSEKVFSSIMPIVSECDYSILNLECPITHDDAYKLKKFGPHLKNEEGALRIIKNIGFDCVTLANNHINDYTDIGVIDTLGSLNDYGIDCLGAGENIKKAKEILYKTINGDKIAIINCCESEYSIATEINSGAIPLNPVHQYYLIKEAKERGCFVVVIVHGGIEHYQLPTPRMKENYHFFVDTGADLVVNHHQHCFSGYERYKDGLIFYGLGNFYFDTLAPTRSWSEGFLLEIDTNNKQNIQLHPYIQCLDNIGVQLMDEEERKIFDDKMRKLNIIIGDDDSLKAAFKEFCNEHEDDYINVLSPYRTRLLNALHRRHLIPGIMTRAKWLLLKDMFTCESHYDRFLVYINSKM